MYVYIYVFVAQLFLFMALSPVCSLHMVGLCFPAFRYYRVYKCGLLTATPRGKREKDVPAEGKCVSP